jgi:uncharacterized protein YjbI with pentapeptide repeats
LIKRGWGFISARRRIFIRAIVALAIMSLFLWFGYTRDWMGFNYYVDSTGAQHSAKTFWDWMELLLVPLVLAIGGFLFSREERRAEREAADQRAEAERGIADSRNRETTLQNYLDKMTELLLEKKLSNPKAPSVVQDIARARTVTTLRQLDVTRRNLLLGFLYQANLIRKSDPVRILHEADLHEADLSDAILNNADLSGAFLTGAHLSRAFLGGANLQRALLNEASLRWADLREADLREADLLGANLSGAGLYMADMSGADLTAVDLSGALLIKTCLSGSDLSYVRLNEADLSGSDLSGAHLNKATLNKTKLIEACLEGADLRESELIGADLSRADLKGADLRGAALIGADLSGADLRETKLGGARYSDDTRWPEGFTPQPEATNMEIESAPPPVEVKEEAG